MTFQHRVAFIPARSGSKSIPEKNLLRINGKTLLERSINSAVTAEFFDSIFVSTDSDAYADLAVQAGAVVPFLRPSHLSNDSARTVDVIIDFFERYSLYDPRITRVFLLQPTSPFRAANHIKECMKIVEQSDGRRSLISITDVGGNHPYRMQSFDGTFCLNYGGFEEQNFSPRQELPRTYIRNGALYTSMLSSILATKKLIESSPYGYEMNSIDSVNIDSWEDFWLAEKIAELGLRD